MSLALHGHQILLIATLAFAAAVLIPFWYTSPNLQIKRNIFEICYHNTCYWTLLPTSDNQSVRTSRKKKVYSIKKKTKIIIFVVLPILVASLAIACAGTSLIGLLLGSWYIQRFSGDIGSKWLLVLTIFSVFLSCM